MPPTYLCQRCSACCRWPGFVRVTEEEVSSIASHMGMEEDAFIQEFTRLRPDRGGLVLIDREDGACFFLKGKTGRADGFPVSHRMHATVSSHHRASHPPLDSIQRLFQRE